MAGRQHSRPEGQGEQRTGDRRRAGKAKTVRLFVGLYPPLDVARQALASVGKLDLPPHRLTAPDQVHLTLLFIGEVVLRPAGVLDEIVESVERSAAGIRRFRLEPTELLTLPKRGPARLIALSTTLPGELVELHDRLVRRLAQQTRQRPSDRFLPHLTLCRFRSPMSAEGLRQQVLAAPLDLPAFEAVSLRLMRSRLQAGGAVHEEVARAELAHSG